MLTQQKGNIYPPPSFYYYYNYSNNIRFEMLRERLEYVGHLEGEELNTLLSE